MTKLLRRALHRLGVNNRGAAMVETAFVLPLVIFMSLGILEFILVLFESHRATEATRLGARLAMIVDPIAKLETLDGGGTVICDARVGTLDCHGAAFNEQDSFARIIGVMQQGLPRLTAQNVEVIYSPSNIGDITTPGGLKPEVTINLVDFDYDFSLLSIIPGLPSSMTFPTFSTSVIGVGYSS